MALAQGTSVITGTVLDAATGKPVPDVVVTATSPARQGEELVVTDSTGLYRFTQLPAGVYALRLEKEAYRPFTRGDVAVRVDRTVRVNIELQPEAVEDTIVVVGRAPTVDVQSSATGINVGREFIDNISFVRPTTNGIRSFESLASVAPQVAADDYGYGFSGATSPENLVMIDGLNVNDTQTGLNGAQLPVDFIQEANIITGGYMAEYGRAGGGIINAVTKSGSNEFHGGVWANWSPGLLTADQKSVTQLGVSRVRTDKMWNIADFGADLGGPIVKDKLWFYVGVAPSFQRVRQGIKYNLYDPSSGAFSDRPVQTDTDGDGRPDADFELSRFDDRRSLTYIAKLQYNLTNDHNLTLSVNGASSNREVPYGIFTNSGDFQGMSSGSMRPESNTNLTLKYTGALFDRHVLLDAAVGWFHQTDAPFGLPNDGSVIGDTTGAAGMPSVQLRNSSTRYNLPEFRSVPADVAAACTGAGGEALCPVTGPGATYVIGGYGYMQQNVNDRITARAKVTGFFQAAGHHELKAGVDYEHAIFSTAKAYSGDIAIREATDGSFWQDYRRFAYLTGPGPNDIQDLGVVRVAPTTNNIGFFLQDSWHIFDVITVNAGVRYDSQVLYDAYGNQSMALNNMWSPRVGVVYDFTQKGRSKIFANFARYYQGIPLNIADRALSGENTATLLRRAGAGCAPNAPGGVSTQDYLSSCADYLALADVVGDDALANHYLLPTGQGRTAIDPNLQAQAKDEFVAGAEYEILPDLRVGATYTKSWMVNIIEDMSNDEANTYFIGNPGQGLASQFPGWYGGSVGERNCAVVRTDPNLSDSERNYCPLRDYDAVTVHAIKAFSDGWLAQASYTWSSLRGSWAGFYNPSTLQLDPGSNSVFDLRSLLANNYGPLPGDRTHYIKFYAAKNFEVTKEFGLLLGVTYEGRSGTPISYMGGHPIYGPTEAFILERGAAGRTPWLHTFNLKAGASYRLSKDTQVAFTVDVLNLFNLQAATLVDEDYTLNSVLPYTPANGETRQQTLERICAAGPGSVSNCVSAVDDTDTGDKLTSENINANFKQPLQYQQPLQVRFGVRFTF